VNGDDAHPLYKFLKSQKKGVLGSESIKWNFTKFLIAPDGAVLKRYGSADTPDAIERDVATLVEAAKS
jgi:glutathione peroxidase